MSGSSSDSESSSDVDTSIRGSGGDSSKLRLHESAKSSDSFDDWWSSIDENPGKINIKYNPIYDLVTDSSKKAQIQNALSDYLRSDFGYEIFVTNESGNYSTTIAIGTDDASTLEFKFPENPPASFGSLMVIADLQTSSVVETVSTNQMHDGKLAQRHVLDKISDTIKSYEEKGGEYLYFISQFVYVWDDQQDYFLWYEKIGAEPFIDFNKEHGDRAYVLVGHSNLGESQGQSLLHIQHGDTYSGSARAIGYANGDNGLPDFDCEFSGGITKTVDGFTTINTPMTSECN